MQSPHVEDTTTSETVQIVDDDDQNVSEMDVFAYMCRDRLTETEKENYYERAKDIVEQNMLDDPDFCNKGNGRQKEDEAYYLEMEEKTHEAESRIFMEEELTNACDTLLSIMETVRSILVPPHKETFSTTETIMSPSPSTPMSDTFEDTEESINSSDSIGVDFTGTLLINSISTDEEFIIDLTPGTNNILQGKIRIRGCDIIEGKIIIEDSRYLHTPAHFSISPALPYSLFQLKDCKNFVTKITFILNHLKKHYSTLSTTEIGTQIEDIRVTIQQAETVLLNRYKYSPLSPFTVSNTNTSFKVGANETAIVDFSIYRAFLRVAIVFLSDNINSTKINQNTDPLKGSIVHSNVILKGKAYHVEDELYFCYNVKNLFKVSELLHTSHLLIDVLQNNYNNVF